MQQYTDGSKLPGLLNWCLPPKPNALWSQWEEGVLEHQVLDYSRHRQQFSLRLPPETETPPSPPLARGESTSGNNLNWQQSPSECNRAICGWHITQFSRKWWWTLNCISHIIFTEKKRVAKRRLKIVWQITTQMKRKLSIHLSTSTLQTSNHKKKKPQKTRTNNHASYHITQRMRARCLCKLISCFPGCCMGKFCQDFHADLSSHLTRLASEGRSH